MRSSLLNIFLIVFIDLLGFGIVIPILPYYAESFGASALTLGLLLVCYSGMQFFFAPYWGNLSDKIGRRKVLLICILGIALSLLILGFAPTLTWLFIGRILAGFFGANISVASAYVADITQPENRAKGMGMVGAAIGMGFLFGPALGGILSQWGYGTAAFVAAGLAFLNFVFAYFTLVEPKISEEERGEHRSRFTWDLWWKTIRNPETGLAVSISFLVSMGHAQIETILAYFLLVRFDLGAMHAGFIMAFMAVFMVAIQGGAIGPLVKKIGEVKLLLFGIAFATLTITVAAPSKSLPLLVAFLSLYAVGYGVVNPALMGLISCYASRKEQGITMGVYRSSASLARIIGPLLAGFLFDAVSYESPFYSAALFILAAFVLLVVKQQVWAPSNTVSAQTE